MTFTETERAILRIVQRDLPDSLTPFTDIAKAAGTDEASVLALLRRMKETGAIRRFGATIKHEKAGFTHNAMVAWKIAPEYVDEAGEAAAAQESVSHCYYRPSPSDLVDDWPYTLYTMVHGRSAEECDAAIQTLAALPHMAEHAVLKSLKELKKISMAYF